MDEKQHALAILKRLDGRFSEPPIVKLFTDPFRTLVATILSQNTTDDNAIKAFRQLEQRFRIAPEVLAQLDPEEIVSLVRVAGLQEQKARAIVAVAQYFVERWGGDPWQVVRQSRESIRSELVRLPGVGEKTVDVLLLIHHPEAAMPVDTHIRRVALRLGLVQPGSYKKIRDQLETLYAPSVRRKADFLLLMLGRTYCRARNPKCEECPVRDLCSFPKTNERK